MTAQTGMTAISWNDLILKKNYNNQMFKLGIESFIEEEKWKGQLENRRIAFLGHQASVSQNLQSSLSLIKSRTPLKINGLIGPQHGFKSTEQANMITTKDEHTQSVPVFSLYSDKTRRLTQEMLSHFDVLIVDLQDVGCRVYTYLTTLFYVLEDCAQANKEVWVLDRPNPAGRKIEGSLLNKDFTSFVGAAPLPIRHGFTLGEAALWYRSLKNLNVKLEIIEMKNYQPEVKPWPENFPWVPPSPNMVDEECARCYSGTVLLEGTKISEARGTVFPLKAFGFPGMNTQNVLRLMAQLAPRWLKGCILKEEFFQPVFDKFQNQNCSAIRIYATGSQYDETTFQPYRLTCLFLKCVKKAHPDFDWIQPPPYEYEQEKMPIDILSGDDFLRNWIEDPNAFTMDLEAKLSPDEKKWTEQREKSLIY